MERTSDPLPAHDPTAHSFAGIMADTRSRGAIELTCNEIQHLFADPWLIEVTVALVVVVTPLAS